MKKTYLAPTIESFKAPQLMISVSPGGTPVEDPDLVESKQFWGGSIIDDVEPEEEKTAF